MRSFVVAAFLLVAASNVSAQALQAESFRWVGELERGDRVHVRNVRGSIVVQYVAGQQVTVVADKRWRRSGATAARIEARRVGQNLVICALFAGETSCEPLDAVAQPQAPRRAIGDIVVDIVVRVPRGAPTRVVTLHGNVSVLDATGDVEAQSVNGDVAVRTASGNVFAGTVNGGVTAFLFPPYDADVELTTSHGRLRSEFEIAIHGRMEAGRLRGRIGRGGRLIRLTTINGNLLLLRGG